MVHAWSRQQAQVPGSMWLPGQGQRRQRSGSAAVEVALALTLLVPFIIGVWEVGRLVQVQQMLANAAREGGRQAASGTKNAAAVKQVVVNYLTTAGISVTASNVTVTNLTSGSDPTTAKQLDQIQVSVAIPFDSVRWVLLNQITSVTQLSSSSTWSSMNDIPITVNSTVPLQ